MSESSSKFPGFSISVDIIKSAKDLFDIAAFQPSEPSILFRGQSTDWPLLPKIARLAKDLELDNPEKTEEELLSTFKAMSLPILDTQPPSTYLEWMALARHHGLPTRLLDWTSNPFYALWFAVEAEKNASIDQRVLFVLEVDQYDLKLPEGDSSQSRLPRTIVFKPPHISRNIAAQSAWFTVHKYLREKNHYVPLEKNRVFGKKITKYYVDPNAVSLIRRELKHLGISYFSLFPDLDHLSKYLEHDLVARIKGI